MHICENLLYHVDVENERCNNINPLFRHLRSLSFTLSPLLRQSLHCVVDGMSKCNRYQEFMQIIQHRKIGNYESQRRVTQNNRVGTRDSVPLQSRLLSYINFSIESTSPLDLKIVLARRIYTRKVAVYESFLTRQQSKTTAAQAGQNQRQFDGFGIEIQASDSSLQSHAFAEHHGLPTYAISRAAEFTWRL